MPLFPEPEVFPVEHAFRERRNLKPRDRCLRRHGYRIEYRPKVGEAIWSKDGILYVETEALELCSYEAGAPPAGNLNAC